MRTLAKTPVPMSTDDIQGWENLEASDQADVKPLLVQFAKDRTAKLNGTAPKKAKKAAATASTPKASGKAAVATMDDWFSPTKSSAPSKPSAAPKAPGTPANGASGPKDPYGLKQMLDGTWGAQLSPLINATPGIEKLLSTFSPNLPNKAHLFETLRGLSPVDVNLIIIKDRPYSSPAASSGFPFHDASVKTLANSKEPLSAFLRSARTHSNAQGNLVDWETYNSRNTTAWFEAVKQQGTLFLHRELSIDPNYANASTSWEAVVLKIIKNIFAARSEVDGNGVVVVLFGGMDQLKREIQHIHKRFQEKVPVRIVDSTLPEDPEFQGETNLFETIDSFLLETDNDTMNWFPDDTPEPAPAHVPAPKAAPIAPKAAPIAPKKELGEEKFPAAPPMAGKMTSRVQLTSMDGRSNLDLGKLHRNFEGKSGTFLLRSVDLEADNPYLSARVAVFTMGAKGAISITVLSTNPIMYCPGNGAATARAITAGTTLDLKRGDILGFVGEDFTYRIDPYNFAHPPTNRYMPESGNGSASGHNSTNASFMDDDVLEARAQDAKRPFAGDFEDDESFAPTVKKTKPKAAALDWMDDDEEEGDGEYKPSKHGESAYDHIIDNKHDADSDEEEAAFFADKRPLCMYGSECHQKNPKHIAKYRHPPHTVANPKK